MARVKIRKQQTDAAGLTPDRLGRRRMCRTEYRVVVLGECVEAVATIHMALWLWPHDIVTAIDATDAVRLTEQQKPDAVIVTDPVFYDVAESLVVELLRLGSTIPVVVLHPYGCSPARGSLLEREAFAVLSGEAENTPVLQHLLARARRNHNEPSWRANDLPPRLPPLWRDSKVVGALICDESGAVMDANQTVATWLGMGSGNRLVGRDVWRGFKIRARAWPEWEKLSAGIRLFLQGSWSVEGPDEQVLTVQLDVLTGPADKRYMHVSLFDQASVADAYSVAKQRIVPRHQENLLNWTATPV